MIAQREYERNSKENESQESWQKRLAQQHENKTKSRASGFLTPDENDWPVNLYITKKLQMNLLGVDNKDWQTNVSMREKIMQINLLNDVDSTLANQREYKKQMPMNLLKVDNIDWQINVSIRKKNANDSVKCWQQTGKSTSEWD